MANIECINFIQSLLQLDQEKRPSALQCLQNIYLANYQRFKLITIYNPPLLEDYLKKKIPEITFQIVIKEDKNSE